MRMITALPFIASVLATLFPSIAYTRPTSESSPTAKAAAAHPPLAFEDPWPGRLGIAPRFGHQILSLQKRECLGNGSNFCFEDPGKGCPGCGGCCELGGDEWCCPGEGDRCCPGETCCKADESCCGDGCCPKGRRCSDGKCEIPVVTVTSTKIVHATRTRSEVEVVTVQVNVRVTSTLNSIITTTVTSDQGTQTDVTYETTTLLVKRSLPTPALGRSPRSLELDTGDERPDAVARAFSRAWRRLVFGGPLQRPEHDERLGLPTGLRRSTSEAISLRRRQENDDDVSKVTVTVTNTIVDKTTTVTDSKTTTDFITSTVTKTIFQTSTRVIGARETVSTTSTVIITSRSPTTDTVTSTSTSFLDPTESSRPPATTPSLSDAPSTTSLDTPAMIGIGVGTGFTALSLAILALLLLRRSRKKKAARLPPDYVIAPAPAPIPSPRRDAYFASKGRSPGHSRGVSAATSPGSSGSDNRGEMPVRMQMRSIPHPSSSTVGRMTRFAEREGSGPGGMG